MALRLFTKETGWELARRDVRHTAAALAASPAHGKLVAPLRKLLGTWDGLDAERRLADDALVDAHALVRFLDLSLDDFVSRFAGQLLAETGRDATHPTFKSFFPEAPSEIVRLGLESEIERVGAFHVVAEHVGVSKESAATLKAIAKHCDEGKKALAAREKATLDLARVSLKVVTWKESANAARRSVETALEAHALEAKLPRSYADAFFPASVRAKKRSAPADAPTPLPA